MILRTMGGRMRADTLTMKRARAMRQTLSPPEAAIWSQIKGCKLDGLRFRRQHPVGPYILDFYCEQARLAVEIDGMGHGMGDRPARDARRDAWLLAQGVETLRLDAALVRGDLSPVLRMILGAARARI